MRFDLESRHNGRRRLFSPFASSPAILSLFLTAIVVCIVLLEVVITISRQNEANSKRDISTRDIQAQIEHVTTIWTPAPIKRQDDTSDTGDDSGSDGDTTSSDTGTDTSTSTTDNTSTSNGDDTTTGTTDDTTASTGDDTATTADDTDSTGDETTTSTGDDTATDATDDTSSATDDDTSSDTDDTSTNNEDDTNSGTGDDTSDNTQDDTEDNTGDETGDETGDDNSASSTDDTDDTTADDSENADGNGDDDGETSSGDTDGEDIDDDGEDNTDDGEDNADDGEDNADDGQDTEDTDNETTDGSDDDTANEEDSENTDSENPSDPDNPADTGSSEADNSETDDSNDPTNSNSETEDNSANSEGVDESDGGNGNNNDDSGDGDKGDSSNEDTSGTTSSDPDEGTTNIDGSSGSASTSANPLVPSVGPAAVFAKSRIFQDQGRPLPLPSGVKAMPIEVTSSVYFTATFLLIIIAVCFKTLWLVIFANIKLNEPFYHLALPGGADPTTGLFFEFLATGFPIDHFKAGLAGNWTSWYMITSYAALMLLLMVPSVASEAFSIQNVKGTCRSYDTADLTCAKRAWTVSTQPVRVLELLLALLAAAILAVMVMQLRRKHTLSVKTTDLETIGHVLKDRETLAVLRRVTPESTAGESYAALTQYRYRLESPTSSHEIAKDVLRCSPEQHPPEISHTLDFLQHILAPLARIQSTLDLVIPGFLILLLMTMIMYYVDVSSENSKLTSFLQNNRFGAKFILSNITILLGISFCRVEYEVRILTTYRSLYLAKNPQAILSRSLHGSPFTQTWSAIKHGQWVCALVSGMASFGVQLLSITIVNVPWHSGNSIQNTSMCILISMILLALMAGSLAAVAVWRRSLPVGIPRVPATLADIAVLMVHDRVPGVVLGREEKETLM